MSRRLRRYVIGASVLAFALTMVPSDALAQRGRARAPAGSRQAVARPPAQRPSYPSHQPYYRSYRPYYGYGYYRPYYGYGYYRPYYPYYYQPFYWGVGVGWGYGGWGYGGYGAYGHPWYPQPYYGGYYDYDEASARLEVTPRDAQVFVDGYFVGSVDDFDGVLQRLHVRAGEHTLEIYKEGYRTIRERVDFRRGETYKVKFAMEPLGAGEAAPPRPAPDPKAPARDERPDRMYADPLPPRGAVRGDGGAIALRVQPDGAAVLVDGERWDPPGGGAEPLVIQLEEGTHRIEVQKEGYRPYTADIRVRRGETVPLNINLRREGN